MLFQVDVAKKSASEVSHVTLSQLQLNERYDLQEWVLDNPKLLGEELLVLTSEFSGFDKTAERLDVLAIDRRGLIVVIELKRSAVGTAAELQALRYAAYCSTLSLSDLSELLAAHAARREGATLGSADAERRIREFVSEPDFEVSTDKPRIILGAEDFSSEITATVLWLRTFGVDISCIRLRPYSVAENLLLETSILIPLPEARAYQVRREQKAAEQSRGVSRSPITAQEYLSTVNSDVRPIIAHLRNWVLAQPDVTEEAFQTLLSYRRCDDRDWVTWLQFTRWEARAAIRPEVDIDPSMRVKTSPGGWPIVRARSIEEAVQVESLLERSMMFRGTIAPTEAAPEQPG